MREKWTHINSSYGEILYQNHYLIRTRYSEKKIFHTVNSELNWVDVNTKLQYVN